MHVDERSGGETIYEKAGRWKEAARGFGTNATGSSTCARDHVAAIPRLRENKVRLRLSWASWLTNEAVERSGICTGVAFAAGTRKRALSWDLSENVRRTAGRRMTRRELCVGALLLHLARRVIGKTRPRVSSGSELKKDDLLQIRCIGSPADETEDKTRTGNGSGIGNKCGFRARDRRRAKGWLGCS
ncbi:uncharacterized protein UTRI_06723 [Ustilago trichophora]|uniref:Uncharacterized protein n=1 Tax=Ustilago trichophora TaxID=86804 RepID=A0A5C3EQ59_9BASI|nr:uncharacterized protein UTRI_06723 [Ustilago trichophora]